METLRSRESREKPSFQLTIVVHRHGEKASLAGDLSERGKEETEAYFENAYDGVALDLPEGQGVAIEHSPIGRAEETAMLAARHSGVKIESITTDERLSEGTVAHHKDLMNTWGGTGGKWVPTWMNLEERPLPDVKTGKEAIRDFSAWLIEKIKHGETAGGKQEIDAFSHFPVMFAFLLKLEQMLSVELVPKDWQDGEETGSADRVNRIVHFLQSFNFYIDSKEPSVVQFSYSGKKVAIPLSVLEQLAQ